LKNPHQLHKYGTALIWIGVLVWVPYFALRIAGESPALLMYLPFHLASVIGGARIRSSANNRLGKPKEKRKPTVHLIGILGGTGLMGAGSAVKYFRKKRME
jgi:hypothetical protein